jgi:hypothetical protein
MLDRALDKAKQSVEVADKDGAPIAIEISETVARKNNILGR